LRQKIPHIISFLISFSLGLYLYLEFPLVLIVLLFIGFASIGGMGLDKELLVYFYIPLAAALLAMVFGYFYFGNI